MTAPVILGADWDQICTPRIGFGQPERAQPSMAEICDRCGMN